jgi:hypothetical protein
MRTSAILVYVLLLSFAPMALARGGGHSGGHSSGSHSSSHSSSHISGGHSGSHSGSGHSRSGHQGKSKRSKAARHSFMKSHPCPSTGRSGGACPGYVVDHVVPLKRGGADAPSNMQWQTKEEAKAKDKWE